ncbi:MAG: hypothetical protein K1W24_03175 [Lachnospiraceae bacterium]
MENTAEWIITTEENYWINKEIPYTTDNINNADIIINGNIYYQTMDQYPWGGCLADRGYMAMEKLPDNKKHEIINALFGDGGLGFTTARLPMGNNDYSDTHKSYNENNNDYSMEHFSLATDETYLLPYIKMALKTRPGLDFFATPWSPPSWLKQNNCIHGIDDKNRIIFTQEALEAYALYFVKYIKSYGEHGIHINAITPQNEPTMNTLYASCVWTGTQLNIFIRDYLYPAMQKAGINNTKIWLGTFTDSDASLVVPALEDVKTNNIIDAVCFQWWGSYLAKAVQKGYGKKLVQSETKCGDGKNNWCYAEEQFDCFKEFLEAGVSRYYIWNMVLDEKGANTAKDPWYQNSPVTVNSKTLQVTFNPSYYLTKHFSHFIKGGAKRIEAKGNCKDIEAVAFKNTGGQIITELKNGSGEDKKTIIDICGKIIQPEIKAHSINTFII